MASKGLVIENEVASIYQEDYQRSMDDLGGGMMLPTLKLIQKLTEAELEGGTKAEVGTLYHTQLKKAYTKPEVAIVYVGKARLPKYQKPQEVQYNQLVVGYLLEDNVPFLLFVKGKNLGDFFKWQKRQADLIYEKKIPMYGFVSTIETFLAENEFGKFYQLKFEIVKDKIISDPTLVKTLRGAVEIGKMAVKKQIEISMGENISDEASESLSKEPKQIEDVNV